MGKDLTFDPDELDLLRQSLYTEISETPHMFLVEKANTGTSSNGHMNVEERMNKYSLVKKIEKMLF